MKRLTNFLCCFGLFLLLFGVGCQFISSGTEMVGGVEVVPAPTIAGFFQQDERADLSPELSSETLPTPEAPVQPAQTAPTLPAPPPLAPEADPAIAVQPRTAPVGAPQEVITTTVYSDEMSENWMLWPDMSMTVITTTEFVHSGRSAIAITPQKDFSTLFFVVNSEAKESYRRDEVLGVSLWLNSGENTVELDNLAVTIIGSNAFPYWVSGDHSVNISSASFFSETRLYYLGLNRPIPPTPGSNCKSG